MQLYDSLPIPLQNLACSWAGFRRRRTRFTPHFHRRLAELEGTASASLDELHEIQWGRLRRLIDHSRRCVPYYEALEAPSDTSDPTIALRQTLERIPPLEKDVYRERCREFLARDAKRNRLIRGKTSGTTGSALPLWYTPEAIAEEFATVWRARRAAGIELLDGNLTFNGQVIVPFAQQSPPFWRFNRSSHQTLFSLYHCKQENLRYYVDEIHRAPAKYIQGYPSAMHLVARAMNEAERPLATGRLRACFTSSESLLAFQRDAIEQAFATRIYDRYGVSELSVSMTECHEGNLHVDMEFGIVEVEIVEESEDWVRGPLLVTGFANEATPMIRYRIGDIGTRKKHPCACGRAGDVFLDIDGRVEDYVRTPDGRIVGRLDHVFKEQLDIAEAQVIQESPESLKVLIVQRRTYDVTSENELLKQFRMRLGEEIAIDLDYVDSIAREANGKLRAVKSSLGPLP
jgi:phenylacetate-CoA ligase